MTPYDQKTISHRFATFLVNNPLKSILLGLLLAAALIPGVAHMQTDFSYRIWFRETDPLLAQFDAFERRFGNDEMVTVVAHSPSGVFDKETATLLQALTDDMWRVPEVIRVDSLTNYNWTHAEGDDLVVEPLIPDDQELTDELLAERREVALNHEVIPDYLVSSDGTAAIIYAQLKPAIGGTPNFEIVVEGARKVLDKYRPEGVEKTPASQVHLTPVYPGPGDHQFYLTGPAAISHTFKELTQADMTIMVPVLLAAIALFLFLSFRRLSGMLMPFMIIFLSIAMTLGASGWMGVRFNNLTAIVPHILIAISVADAVHILVTYFQFRRMGLERKEATHKTLVKNLQPTLLTSVSTSIGFFSFASAKIVPIMYMGLLAGIGTLLAWLATILVLSPMLVLIPIKVKRGNPKSRPDKPHPLAVRYAGWLMRNRFAMLTGFVLIIGASIWLALINEINSDPFKYYAKNVHTRIANEFAESKVGGMMALEIAIDSGAPDGIKEPAFLAKVERLQDWLEEQPHTTKTIAVTDIVKQTNRSLNGDDQAAYLIPDSRELIAQEMFLYTMSLPQGMDLNNRMTLDNDMIRLTAMSTLHESRQALLEIDKIETKAAELGLDAHVTGKMPLYHNMNPYVVNAFIVSISMALVLVAILMIVTLRSWKLGLLSMIPNTVPLIFGGAIMTVLGKPLDVGTVLVTSTCLGIAVDDTIHFLSNYNRWRKLGSDRTRAIAHVITHTGPALLVTTLVLVVAFATFAFASFVPNINFGIITAIVLSTALITDGTLLPALLLTREARETSVATAAEAVA